MTIRYECKKCNSVLKIKEDRAGQKGKCPKCHEPFIIPVPDEASDNATPAAATSLPDDDDLVAAYLSEGTGVETQSRPQPAFTADEVEEKKVRASGHVLSKAGGSAAGTAGDLLSLTGRKSRESEWEDPESAESGKTKKLIDEIVSVYGRQAVFALVGIFVFAPILYWVASQAMSSSRDLPDLAELSGVVTLNSKPLAGARVKFVPTKSLQPTSKIRVAASFGWTDGSGQYSLRYTRGVDGVAVGKHRVEIRAYDNRGLQFLPVRYNSVSELSWEVKPGGNEPANFNLVSTN